MLNGKVCLVTGGAAGIGKAVALVWAREGAKVVVSDIDDNAGLATVEEIKKLGAEAIYVHANVREASQLEHMVNETVKHFGRLDVACNNAGIGGVAQPVADYPLDNWSLVIDINLSSVFYSMKYQIPAMLKNGGGSIINMASILGAVGFETAAAYASAKHGVVGLTQTAAIEYSSKGLRVNAVGPGFIETALTSGLTTNSAANAMLIDRHPIGRLGKPEEVAELVLWLSTDRASFVTGSYYPVDGGYLAK